MWLDERKGKCIKKDEWMANSPDLSPVDNGINSYFKKLLKGKKARDLGHLERIVKQAWGRYKIQIIRRILLAWPERVQTMLDNRGYQIEHIL